MATLNMASIRVLALLSVFSSLYYINPVMSFELQVGDDNGWVVPPSNNTNLYNEWASSKRFQVNNTLRFKYVSDSVMEVTEAEYNKCKSTHPIFFSNNGDTVFIIKRPGLFYFISGVDGHCGKGQKMIIKVLEPKSPPPANETTLPSSSADSSLKKGSLGSAGLISILLFTLLLAHFM